MFTLAHLSDPHLAPLPVPRLSELISKRITGYINWQRGRRSYHDPAVLAKIVVDLKMQAYDQLAVTGDIVNIALSEEFPRGRKWLESLGTPADVTFIPGNHDIYVRGAAKAVSREWGAYMSGDDGTAAFPFLRRRGPLALIGLNTGVPTAPFQATGWLGADQRDKLSAMLGVLKKQNLFRVVLIHHPPASSRPRSKRLLDADDFLRVVAAQGCELVIHGHDHVAMINWLKGPDGRIPAIGVPSASGAPGTAKDAAAFNLYQIDGSAGAWTCEMVSRGITPGGTVVEQQRLKLIG
jgi:3',5'-cyclic AMP phosphodiesterase CpdA